MPALDMEKSRINLIGVFYVFLGRLTLVNEDIPGSAARGKAACIGILRNSGVGTHGSCAHALHRQTLSPVPAQDPTPLMPFSGHFSPPTPVSPWRGRGVRPTLQIRGEKGEEVGAPTRVPFSCAPHKFGISPFFLFLFLPPPHPPALLGRVQ